MECTRARSYTIPHTTRIMASTAYSTLLSHNTRVSCASLLCVCVYVCANTLVHLSGREIAIACWSCGTFSRGTDGRSPTSFPANSWTTTTTRTGCSTTPSGGECRASCHVVSLNPIVIISVLVLLCRHTVVVILSCDDTINRTPRLRSYIS